MDILTVFIGYSIKKNVLKIRKTVFEKMMGENSYRLIGGDIIVMKGAATSGSASCFPSKPLLKYLKLIPKFPQKRFETVELNFIFPP